MNWIAITMLKYAACGAKRNATSIFSSPVRGRRNTATRVRVNITLLCLALFLALQSCSPPPEQPPKPTPLTLKVTYQPYISFGPILIAQEEGYFAEQGLEIEFIKLRRSPHGIPALIQGELDVLTGAINAGFLNAIARGAPIKIVADKGHVSAGPPPSMALLARRALVEQGVLDDPDKLRGLKLITNKDNTVALFVDKALEKFGINLDDLHLFYVPPPARLAALQKGTADIVTESEPWLTRALEAGHAVLWVPDYEIIPDFQFACVTFGPSLLEERPEAGRRFMLAYLKAVRQYNQGKTERNLEILGKHTKLDRELLMKACWIPFRSDGMINVQSVLDFQAWAMEQGLIDATVAPNDFWEPAFVEYADAVLERAQNESE